MSDKSPLCSSPLLPLASSRTLAPLLGLLLGVILAPAAHAAPKKSTSGRPAGDRSPAAKSAKRTAAQPVVAPKKTGSGTPEEKASASERSGVKAWGDTFAQVAEKIAPSVVQIDVATRASAGALVTESGESLPHRRGTGSGIVFAASGAILTNDHVIEHAEAVTVRFQDGRSLPATIAGRDPEADLAVLRVDARDLTPVVFADSDSAKVGEWVVAIGSPYGLGHSVTAGVLSAKGRGGLGATAVEDFLQTDASIHPGNSGGPLVTLDGRVVGINTMVVAQGGGIGFAVPSNMARRIAQKLLEKGKIDRPFVGMHLQDLTPDLADEFGVPKGGGALVSTVAPEGPAERANVKAGDVLVEADGVKVSSARDLVRRLLEHEATATVPLVVSRAGKRYQSQLTLVPRQDVRQPILDTDASPVRRPSGLGLTLRDREEAGVVVGSFVVDVAPGSSADRAGLRPGDLIIEADGAAAPDAAAMTKAARDGRLLLRIRRGDRPFYAALRRDVPKK
jgi:serine protease Do